MDIDHSMSGAEDDDDQDDAAVLAAPAVAPLPLAQAPVQMPLPALNQNGVRSPVWKYIHLEKREDKVFAVCDVTKTGPDGKTCKCVTALTYQPSGATGSYMR